MKALHLALQPAGTLGSLEPNGRSNTVPIGRSRGDGVACDVVADVYLAHRDGKKLAALFAATDDLFAVCEYVRGTIGDMPPAPDRVAELEERHPELRNYLTFLRGTILTSSKFAGAAIAKATGN